MTNRLQAILVVASLVSGTAGAATMLTARDGRDFDLVASANPGTPGSRDTDRTAMFERARGRTAQADAVASASATCDGCRGTAATVQVIYVNKAKRPTADNLANAWSTCTNCRATAVSVQVLVVRPGVSVAAQNRAFAVNASCSGCTSAAVAVQLVVVTNKHRTLSRKGRQQLEALANELQNQLTNRTKAKLLAAPKNSDSTGLEAVVRKELKPLSVKPHISVQTR
ncbi:hypothetical protein [Kribbella sp. NPDC048915]|uniref:hypothetical protein n=1 Tax=Kribbella sp. NPDC048915 TaxID=3155148 RepID=UPI0034037B99